MRRRGNLKQAQAVKGHVLPSPHLTPAAYRMLLMALFALLLLLDGVFYLLFRYVFHVCYGLLCLL